MNIPFWKKFLAVVLICFSTFLTSCESKSNSYDVIDAPAPATLSTRLPDSSVTTAHLSDSCNKGQSHLTILDKDAFEANNMIVGFTIMNSDNQIKAPIINNKAPIVIKEQ